jgi:GNAT superfamily N-acetyltransferase
MTYTIKNLHDISSDHLPRLAEIHLGDHGLLASLGYPFALRYFEAAYHDPRVIGLVAQDDETGEVMGYGIAAPEPEALNARLTADKKWFAGQIVKIIFTRPLVFVQLLISSITIKGQMKDESGAIECVYISVDPAFRGYKLGQAILKTMMDWSREAGYKKIIAMIETVNIASVKMCQAKGLEIVRTFREGGYLRYRMECSL